MVKIGRKVIAPSAVTPPGLAGSAKRKKGNGICGVKDVISSGHLNGFAVPSAKIATTKN